MGEPESASCCSAADERSVNKPKEQGVNVYTPPSISVLSAPHTHTAAAWSLCPVRHLCVDPGGWSRAMDRLVLLPKPLAHCDTLPCSTSTLAAPSDLTPPLFAVHLCTSRTGVECLWLCASSCLGESLPWACTQSWQRATGLIWASKLFLSLLKLVNMLPFLPCPANQHMDHSRTRPPSVIQYTGFSWLNVSQCPPLLLIF